ncbi:hypothetical protein OSB04_002217 [Centaurea solstitialis]|uniref:non-specific serine/threonine protein kinase n=1 Tax=Centaurea solstitialis TaxID=347529 RepID=A0AA38U530_9ASTR|nr:hypothetical protein OSB04_002217 [Centaurea solstitialis]
MWSFVEIDRGSKEGINGETMMDELDLPLFDFRTLTVATNNFSSTNELGEGGFGCVYKGMLHGGEVVAVKRLSRVSDQGIEELTNEVRLIAKLQHRNLVRLLGCCIEVEEKLLIYEFMKNRSLDKFLFGKFIVNFGSFLCLTCGYCQNLACFSKFVTEKEKSMELRWQLRLDIIRGITGGLLYLHQDSRLKIIHRDLKASNILLDEKMNPKISDFGLARIFGSDQIEARTKKVNYFSGYMSPEYAMNGHFSTKSDVFSFGVLVLEIVSGQKNRGSSYTSSELNLLGHTWMLWKEGKALKLVDESLRAKFLEEEALRCIQIGLLCVQEHKEDRPCMSKVLWMLNSEIAQLPQPKYPGFFIGKRDMEVESSCKQDDHATINEVTITMIDATDIITVTQPLFINQTLISAREVFELGFFNLTNNDLYLGIWYREIQPRTYVWLANRDAPVDSSFAKLTIGKDGNINLVDRSETAIWSSNQSVSATNMVAQLLDSGNFVLRRENDGDPENYIWQSFDYPTDNLLPEMKLGWSRKTGINRFLRSWKSDNDPGSGDYSFKVDIDGLPEINVWHKERKVRRTGPWNGRRFSGMPQMKRASM